MKLKEISTAPDELRREIMGSRILGNKWLLERLNEYEKSAKA